MSIFELEAEPRTDMGKGASRRLRRAGKVPAILYGGADAPQAITLSHSEVLKRLDQEAFYSHILTVKVDGEPTKAVLRDLQRHPGKPIIMHMDFQRIDEAQKIRVHVPLHFIGEDVAPGVKQGGGLVTHELIEVELEVLPQHLPEYIEVDISGLELGESVHLSDLKLPQSGSLIELSRGEGHDQTVVSIHPRRGGAEEEAEEAGEGGEAAAGEGES